MATVHCRYAGINGQRLFYREAGPTEAPAVVPLHGFPASSFMSRDRILGRTADHEVPTASDRRGRP